MKNEYDALNRATVRPEEYAPVPLGEAQQAAQLRRLLAAAPAQAGGGTAPEAGTPRRRARGGKRMAALLLAAALACGVLAAGAAGAFAWGADFAAFLGFEQQQLPLLGELSQGLGLTQTVGDASITLEGVLGDNHCVYIPFTVTAPPARSCKARRNIILTWPRFKQTRRTPRPSPFRPCRRAGGRKPARFVADGSVTAVSWADGADESYGTCIHNSGPRRGRAPARRGRRGAGAFQLCLPAGIRARGRQPAGRARPGGLETPLETLELSPISVYLQLAEPAGGQRPAA